MNQVRLGGFRICDTTSAVLGRLLRGRIRRRARTTVFFANANLVITCQHLLPAAGREPGLFIVNDGIAMALAARARRGFAFRDNLNGTDFVPRLLREAPAGTRLFLFGAAADSVAEAARVFAALPQMEVVGFLDGYCDLAAAAIVDRINAAAPDIVLVALGNPRQEEWILANRGAVSAPLVMGVGALFDFTAGKAARAPELLRRLRLEWSYRLYREPARLWKRYTIDTGRFFWLALTKRD